MNVLEDLANGNIEQLTLLGRQADRLRDVQERVIQDSDHIADLRRELMILRDRVAELKQELVEPEGTLCDHILSEIREIPDETDNKAAIDRVKSGLREDAEADLTRQNYLNVTVAYRLAGQTVFLVNGGEHLGVRLETSYLGQYYERYYVFLDMEEDRMVLRKHTIPWFIPLTQLSKEYLNTDIKTFLDQLGDYLNCLVARREQIHQLLRQGHPNMSVSQLNGYSNVRIELPAKNTSIEMVYGLLSTLPSDVRRISNGAVVEEGLEPLKTMRLPSACVKLGL